MTQQEPRGFLAAFKRASTLVKDIKQILGIVNKAQRKALAHAGAIQNVKTDLSTLFRLISTWAKGDYKKVPLQTIVFAVAGVIYFVNPFDAVHDYIPLVGYLDDVTLISFVVRSIKRDLEEFLIWEKHK